MISIADKILKRVRGKGRGSVFLSKDFLDLGSRPAIDQALSRLARQGDVRRLKNGLYDYPQIHPRLGALLPDPDVIANALARKNGARIQPAGAAAANALGLSTQVPAQHVYLTDGNSKRVQLGRQIIKFRRTTPSNLSAAKTSNTVIQALRHLGRDGVDASAVAKLKHTLPDDVKADLKKDIGRVPDWMRPVVAAVTE